MFTKKDYFADLSKVSKKYAGLVDGWNCGAWTGGSFVSAWRVFERIVQFVWTELNSPVDH